MPNNPEEIDLDSSILKLISDICQSSTDSSSEDEEPYSLCLPVLEKPKTDYFTKNFELTPSVYHLMTGLYSTDTIRGMDAHKEYGKNMFSYVSANSNDEGSHDSDGKTGTTREKYNLNELHDSNTYPIKGKYCAPGECVSVINVSTETEAKIVASHEIPSQNELFCNVTQSSETSNLMQKASFPATNNCVEEKVKIEVSPRNTYKSLRTTAGPLNDDIHAVNEKFSFMNVDSKTKDIVIGDWYSPVASNNYPLSYGNDMLDERSLAMDIHMEGKTNAMQGSFDRNHKIMIDYSFQSISNERNMSEDQESPYTIPKRLFQAKCDNHVLAEVKSDQLPYSPSIPSSNFEYFKNSLNTAYLPSYNAAELLTLLPGVGFVDTHCHLDFLFNRTGHSGSYKMYRRSLKKYFPVSYEACVAVFCDPRAFPKESMWKPIIEEDGVWAAFGCHPHSARYYDEIVDESLICAIKHKKVRALGEIGLDYSNKNNCPKEIQHQVFRRQLKIAISCNLPLVLHCRDAADDCFKIMTEVIPRDYKIHFHCFTGYWDDAQKLLDAFPNLFIGITNLVTYPSATSVHEVVKKMPLERLLLETDAPYFLPRTLRRQRIGENKQVPRLSHPGMAIHVAAQVTALRGNISLEEVLFTVRKNTYRMYNI